MTGSGTIARASRPLADWTAVALSCPGTLDLEIGEPRGIAIEAEDNILPLIETRVEQSRLVIRFKSELRSINPTLPIRFVAAARVINSLAVSGSGSIHAPHIESERFAVDVSGSGDIDVASIDASAIATRISGSGGVTLRGQALDHDIGLSGSGAVSANELTCQRATITVSGSGSATINVEHEIRGRISGSGSIVYSGQPSTAIRITGSGRAIQMPIHHS